MDRILYIIKYCGKIIAREQALIKLVIRSNVDKLFNFLNQKETLIGKILWILNSILVLFYVYFILSILLNPFNFLKDFIFAVIVISQYILAVILHSLKIQFKLFPFLDKIPVLYHILVFVGLVFIYQLSVNHIWKNKKDYTN